MSQAPGKHPTPVSIQDVADAAAVSIATVSRVINNPALVSGPTTERVRQAIRELGFRPNLFARGLMTRQSRVLGVALPDIHGEFYSELIRGADTEAHKRGYHLLVSSDARRTAPLPTPDQGSSATTPEGPTLPFGLVDGLALMITEPNEALLREARDSGVPLVVLDSDAPGLDTIVVDNEVGTREATEHLLESVPPARCFFVGGPRENFDTVRRGKAFLATLAARGHAPTPDQAAYGEYSFDWGRRWTESWLARARPAVSGVLAGNDEVAFGITHTLARHGLSVPDDVRVIGFDDTRLSAFLRPALSTVRVPLAQIGVAAVETLCRRLENPDAPPARVRLPTSLVIRETSRAGLAPLVRPPPS